MARVSVFIEKMLDLHLNQLASTRKTDVMAIYGEIDELLPEQVRDELERMNESNSSHRTLTILLDTWGGVVDSVEKMVDVIRYHYERVDFIIPRRAMSAGTIFALSANNIYMDYYSQMGPIDPQFYIGGRLMPGLGYLEKFEELNKKSERGEITPLEYLLVSKLDLADIHQYEQARELSIELLEKWLPAFKFEDWVKTESKGHEVTSEMKQERAKEIAQKLNDTKRWHTHSRGISMEVLQEELGLRIEDIRASKCGRFQEDVREAHSFIVDFMEFSDTEFFFRAIRYERLEDNHE